ncbi:hypothetical protein IKG68_03235 [Candidatus Saccharibacteria bacterium]|nr:hypothetical protein [Candidatus Saccharibacteria bacterium]
MVKRTFRLLLANWKVLAPLLIVGAGIGAVAAWLVGDAAWMVISLMLVVTWLITINVVRQSLGREKIGISGVFANALRTFLSVVVLVVVMAVECVPLILLLVAYAAAVETEFLVNFGYAVGFVVFALLMVVISGYLLAPTIMAAVAVSAPGLMPWTAVTLAANVMEGHRLKFWGKFMMGAAIVVAAWAAVMVPLVLMKAAGVVVVAVALVNLTVIFAASYLYLYYKDMIK